MADATIQDAVARQRLLLDEFGTQIILAGDSSAGQPAEGWASVLDKLAGAGAEGNGALAAEASRLKAELLTLAEGSGPFLDVAEAGMERLTKAVQDPHAEAPSTAGFKLDSIARDPELIADFIVESREHLQAIEHNVLAVEQDIHAMDPIHAMFRAFHTIKGIAGFLEFQEIRDISHETETLLDLARNGELLLTPPVIDVILASADYLMREISRIEGGEKEAPGPTAALIETICAATKPGERELVHDLTVISIAAQTSAPSEAVAGPVESSPTVNSTRRKTAAASVKVDTGKLDFLVDAIGEMVIAQSLVQHNPDLARIQSPALMRSVAQLSRITTEVQKTAMSMRMVPIGALFQKMARLVRDLARKSGKQAELITYGDDIELDRNIVEELADPLMHMLRNSLDHGIELPADREAKGKPATARVELRAAHQGGHILIEIVDDGRGINRDAVLQKAKERGLVSESGNLSDSEVFGLIFEPGFSTAQKVTDISGRGVGMDVVKKTIQSLRGSIETQSVQGQGTTFRLKLPLTLAIIDGLVVAVGRERYIVPIFNVKEMLRPPAGMVSTIEGASEIALIRDRILPVVRLHQRFGIEPDSKEAESSLLIIAESQEKEFCLMVDRLIGKQEVVIKNLGTSLKNVPGVAGGAILGDGKVALILEMTALFQSARAA